MAEEYFTLKLTLSELSPGRYRSRIEDSPIGASRGPGCDFQLAEEEIRKLLLPPRDVTVRRQDLVRFGRALFNLALQDQVGIQYERCLAMVGNKARLRIALSILPGKLIAVPWEYMHDGSSFLLKRGQSIVRVLDEIPPTPGNLEPIKKPLIAVANPINQDQFDAEGHLRKLEQALGPDCQPDIRMRADAEIIRQALFRNTYDALYFVGHGRFTEALEGQLVVEGPENESQYLDAERLAEWTREGKIRFVYLNACSGAVTGLGNPFAGVAKRLMRDGGASSVVAMQAPIAQEAALSIAVEFFAELQRGFSPEVALARARTVTEDVATWGLPVIYSSTPVGVMQGGEKASIDLIDGGTGRMAADPPAPVGHKSSPVGRVSVPPDTTPSHSVDPLALLYVYVDSASWEMILEHPSENRESLNWRLYRCIAELLLRKGSLNARSRLLRDARRWSRMARIQSKFTWLFKSETSAWFEKRIYLYENILIKNISMLLNVETTLQTSKGPASIYMVQCEMFLTTTVVPYHFGLHNLFQSQRESHRRIKLQYESLPQSERDQVRQGALSISLSNSINRLRHLGGMSPGGDDHADQVAFLSEVREKLYRAEFEPLPKLFSDRAARMKQKAEILSADHPLVIRARYFADNCFVAAAASACCTHQWSIFIESINELVGRASQLGQRGQAGRLLDEEIDVIEKQRERYPDYPWQSWLETIIQLGESMVD